MKYLNKTHILVTVLTMLFTTIGNAQISKAEIRATGLTCSMCSNAINKQLKSLAEVANVETDLNTNTFTVTLKAGNSLTPFAFKESVEKAGFFIGSLILTVDSKTAAKSPYILVKESANIPAEVKIQVLDKGYVADKEFKKLAKTYKSSATYASNNEADFHIKFVN